jgi:3-oxoacyl-[acyl-carrier protein] reductase/(S)-1-phenylethanol dehydrogenase
MHELTVSAGAPDILVNNTGIYPNQPFDAMSIAAWRPMFAVNVGSMFRTCQAFRPAMKRRCWAAS